MAAGRRQEGAPGGGSHVSWARYRGAHRRARSEGPHPPPCGGPRGAQAAEAASRAECHTVCHALRRAPAQTWGPRLRPLPQRLPHSPVGGPRPVTDAALRAGGAPGERGLSFSSSKARTMSDVHSMQKQQKHRERLRVTHTAPRRGMSLCASPCAPCAPEGCVAQSHRGHSPRLPWTGQGAHRRSRALGPRLSEADHAHFPSAQVEGPGGGARPPRIVPRHRQQPSSLRTWGLRPPAEWG